MIKMSWKDKSNLVIKRAIEENYTVGDDIEQLFNLISKSYYPSEKESGIHTKHGEMPLENIKRFS